MRFLFFNGPSFSISSRSGNQDSCNAKQGGFLSIACAKYLFRYCSLGNRPALSNEKSWGNSKKMGCLCRLLINSWGVHNIEDSISLANFDSKQLKTKGGIDVGAGGIKVGAWVKKKLCQVLASDTPGMVSLSFGASLRGRLLKWSFRRPRQLGDRTFRRWKALDVSLSF